MVIIKSYSIYMRTFSEYASKLYKEGRTWASEVAYRTQGAKVQKKIPEYKRKQEEMEMPQRGLRARGQSCGRTRPWDF